MKDTSNYCAVYAELRAILGNDECLVRMYKHYNGMTITFPKKLYSQEYVREYIAENYGCEKVQNIARHLNLSERRVRQLAGELREGGGDG